MPHAPLSPHAPAYRTRAFQEIVDRSTTPVRVRWDPEFRQRLAAVCAAAERDTRTVGSGDLQLLARALADWGLQPSPSVRRIVTAVTTAPGIDRRSVGSGEIRQIARTVSTLIANMLSDTPRRGRLRDDERLLIRENRNALHDSPDPTTDLERPCPNQKNL